MIHINRTNYEKLKEAARDTFIYGCYDSHEAFFRKRERNTIYRLKYKFTLIYIYKYTTPTPYIVIF